jgi:cobalt/nickel transport protein
MTTQTEQPQKSNTWLVILGIVVIILLMAIPLIMIQDSEFGGADGLGSEVVAELAPNYDAEWITNWWAPPGGETESMLFALQATAGGILIGYCFGFLHGRKKGREENAPAGDDTA